MSVHWRAWSQLKLARVDTLEEQVQRAWDQYHARETDLLKNSFLQSLKCKSRSS